MNFRKNKRGQIFIIAAVIFVLALYSVVIPYNTIKEYPGLEDYNEISQNYQSEFPKVFNWALYTGTPIDATLESFNSAFLGQAQQIDPNFGVFYIFRDQEGNLHIVNTLNNRALTVSYDTPEERNREITLATESGDVSGRICPANLPCVGVGSDIGNYDEAYFQAEIPNIGDIRELRIEIPGLGIDEPIQINEFTSMTYLMSEESIEIEQDIENIRAVTISQY